MIKYWTQIMDIRIKIHLPVMYLILAQATALCKLDLMANVQSHMKCGFYPIMFLNMIIWKLESYLMNKDNFK
jgi:hypothetical protein